MRILITGSRAWTDHLTIQKAILDAVNGADDVTIVHGAARGADLMAESVAIRHGFNIERYPADWNKIGRAAGVLRNQQMVDLGADVVLAFMYPNSRGTADCVRRAKKAGIKVIQYDA